MTLFNLNYLLKDLFPNIDTLEVRALTYEWGGVGGMLQDDTINFKQFCSQ